MHIKDWIDRISKPNKELGGFPVCPFAAGAPYQLIQSDGNIIPPTSDFEVIIYRLPDTFTQDEVCSIADQHNKKFPNLVFLPDPKDRYTDINGVQTSNGHANVILCQPRKKLEAARKNLVNTKYYDYWDKEYLEEILGT